MLSYISRAVIRQAMIPADKTGYTLSDQETLPTDDLLVQPTSGDTHADYLDPSSHKQKYAMSIPFLQEIFFHNYNILYPKNQATDLLHMWQLQF
jgi:hypothetical protein